MVGITPKARNHEGLDATASRFVDVGGLPWEQTRFPGVESKTLFIDKQSGSVTALIRMAPGARLPDHEHPLTEQSFVLEGTLADDDGECGAGNFVWRPSGSRHQAWTPDGCLVLGVFQVPNRFFEEDGRVTDILEQEWDQAWSDAGNLKAARASQADDVLGGRKVMNKVRLLASIALGATFGLGLAGTASAQDTVRIGSFLAVTGPAAFLGEPERKTLELYVEKLNAAGGVAGHPLELVVYDTGMNAKDAVTFTKRLIEQDEVDALIGGTTTGESMAVLGLVEEAELPFISLGGASVIVDPVQKWVFKTPHTDRMAVGKVYEDMQKEGIATIGLIGGSGGFDKSCIANAEALAAEYDLEIAASETYGPDDTDVTPQLTNLNSAGVEAVLFCGFGAASTIVTKNYAQLGIEAPLYHNHGSCSTQFIEGSGAAAEGVRMPCAALLVADQLPADDPQKEVAQDYAATYTEATGEPISTFGGHAYDALLLLTSAIERAGGKDPAAVRDALEQTERLVGVDGIFTMSPEDHMGLGLDSLKMLVVENGDWKLLY